MKLPETIRAAFVIAGRDYVATVLRKSFLLFLLGPLFPLMLGVGMVGIGAQVDRNAKARARVGLAIVAFATVYAVIAVRLVVLATVHDHGTRRALPQA